MAQHWSFADGHSPERLLLLAVLQQAHRDMRLRYPSDIKHSAVSFFQGKDGSLETICSLLDLNSQHVRERIARRYPEVA